MLLFAFVTAALSDARAETQTFGPFSVDTQRSGIIHLDGDIGGGDALNFRRALAAAPEAELVVLKSDGGLVAMALLIADDIHTRGLSTLIPSGSNCYSACALIFLAGIERQADGELGVHQIYNDANDAVSAQYSISDILDVLNRFDTPIQVLTAMFKTPPQDMYVFSPAEIERYQINRRKGDAPASGGTVPATPPFDATPDLQQPLAATRPQIAQPDLDGESLSRLSAIESYARRPDRLALYAGLDFFGEDIASRRVADAPACARECLSYGEECRAFTFNIDDRVVRGPNCFLKARRGVADGNLVALSGEFLRPTDTAPGTIALGVIDPKAGIYEDVDIPGGDLGNRAYAGATTAQQCRLACVGNTQCVAFTFIKRKAECWLKGTVGQPRYKEGMVSGAKSLESFEATLIELD